MPNQAELQALLDREREFWNAMRIKDARVTERMTDDGCIVVGAQGVSAIDAKTMGKLTAEGQWELQQFAIDDRNAKVRFVGDDVAIVAYKVTERVVVDGRTL